MRGRPRREATVEWRGRLRESFFNNRMLKKGTVASIQAAEAMRSHGSCRRSQGDDRDESGAGIDRFWIEVEDKERDIVPETSTDREAADNAVRVRGGNIAVLLGGRNR